MGLKKYNPTSPGRRHMETPDFAEITKSRPEKALTEPAKKHGGRNNQGRITTRHQGGGHKQRYRRLDFKRDKWGIPAKVAAIEYDPNRSARIALLHYADGEKRYIIAPKGLEVGSKVLAGDNADILPGNCLKLRNMPLGTVIHNLELKLGKGGQLIRSAGTSGQLMAKEGDYAQVRMPSGEQRMIHIDCKATVGEVSNSDWANMFIGKAGRSRWMGIRPTVRGTVQNPCDHPHGGGEGKSPQGNPHPVSPWGWITKGGKTRNNKRTDPFIVRRRPKGVR